MTACVFVLTIKIQLFSFIISHFCLQRLTKEMMIKDITEKKEVKAIEVFKHAIKFFRGLMLNTIDKKGLGVEETNIRWVLTVPAIWSDPAKQFMTEAAELVNLNLLHLHSKRHRNAPPPPSFKKKLDFCTLIT